jgi:predicted dienelactone hydrolase
VRRVVNIVGLAFLLSLAGCGTTDEPAANAVPDAPGDTASGPDVATDSTPDTTQPEPDVEAVGILQLTIDGPDDEALQTVIWYPAMHAPTNRAPYLWLGVIQGQGFVEIPAAPGPWPVVLFSHGSQAVNFQSVDLVEAWVRAGWIVIAPSHNGNTLFDNDKEKLAAVGTRRPRDLAAALVALEDLNDEPGGILEDRADLSRLAVAGHSFGAFTSLVVGGVQIDVDGARARCDAGDDLKGACGVVETLEGPLHDARPASLAGVKAAIALSPAVWGLFGESGSAKADMPIFIASGTQDTVTPQAEHANQIYAALPSPKAHAVFPNAGHYAFSNFCDIPDIETLTKGVIAECGEGWIGHQEAMRMTAEMTILWLDAWVSDNPEALEELRQRGVADWAPDATVELDAPAD